MQITIENYQPKHKEYLLKILHQLVPLHFAQSEIADFEYYLDHEIEHYFVAFLDHKIVGAGGINFEDQQTIGKISWDFIHPHYHGNGIGKALIDHRLTILNSLESVTSIKVRTSQFAYTFYQKNGFELTAVIKDYWAKGFDLYEMYYPKKSK